MERKYEEVDISDFISKLIEQEEFYTFNLHLTFTAFEELVLKLFLNAALYYEHRQGISLFEFEKYFTEDGKRELCQKLG
eukprot:Pgem_evm1s12719